MVALKQLPFLTLGVAVSVGIGFLFWTLYHLAWDRSRGSR
jgi:hypothetical protein